MWHQFVVMGDSVAEGYGDDVGDLPARSFTLWMYEKLREDFPSLQYQNLGFRGSVIEDVMSQQLLTALAANPDLVCITIGANDARQPTWTVAEFAKKYRELIAPFIAANATVLTFTYPDVRQAIFANNRNIPEAWQIYFERQAVLNSAVREISKQHQLFCLDYENFFPAQKADNMSSDMVHPNAVGYKIAGESAYDRLRKRFGF